MINEVFIENKRLDVSAGLSNLLTYVIDDIKDIGSRNTSLSKTLVFPGTTNNNFLFGHIFNVTISNSYNPALDNVGYNFNPSKQADCIIFQNHVQVFKGILRLNKIIILDSNPEYECTVFGELGGVINSVGAAKLEDLDFSVYDHVLNAGNVTGSWTNVSGGSYNYPLIDYGTVSSDKINYDIKAFRPGLFVKEYIEKIFSAAGYTYECALFNTARFKRLIIPYARRKLTVSNQVYIDVNVTGTQVFTPVSATKVNFPDVDTLFNFTASGNNTYNYDAAETVSPQMTAVLAGTYSSNGIDLAIGIFRQRGADPEVLLASASLPNTFGATVAFSERVSIAAEIIQNDDLYVKIYGFNISISSVVNLTSGNFLVTPQSGEEVEITVGQTVEMNRTIQKNILQIDFLASVIKLFNLYVYEDKLKPKFLNIKPQVDFYDLNVSGIVDWTYKLDRSKAIELTPMSELNSRYYDFKFKKDTDYYNELYQNRYGKGYGDYLFDSEFAFSTDRTGIDLIFAATPLIGYAGVDKIVSVMYKLKSGVEEKMDCIIRILQAKRITGVTSWAIKNAAATLASGLTVYGYAGHYDDPDAPADDIQFGVPAELFFTLVTGSINVTQFNVYWSSYMAEITDKDSKLLTAHFKLKNKDIYDLDFSKLIYVDGSYWRLNKIVDWNASEPEVCKCELLKAIILIY